ncbi:unnamed protein product [Hydatigera taeniaeformis]|uniref:Arm_2 domain-containing protein n=1 Tax=Hydatigena taeniaeformis TaxID=6205 RepID=A0A0R3WW65_HYDTA|nr:unnamed protein product [Hydatigera taeniaeformis]
MRPIFIPPGGNEKTSVVILIMAADPCQRDVTLRILYQLSTEEKYRGQIASSGCLPLLMRSILGSAEDAPNVECLGLLINLACDRRAAQSVGEPRGIRMLFRRAFATHDPLLMKLLRNLSHFEELRVHFGVGRRSIVGWGSRKKAFCAMH